MSLRDEVSLLADLSPTSFPSPMLSEGAKNAVLGYILDPPLFLVTATQDIGFLPDPEL